MESLHEYLEKNEKIVKPLADAFEALIGAMFIDCNESLEVIQECIRKCHLLDIYNDERKRPTEAISATATKSG